MKISSYNISANASHSYSGSVEKVDTQHRQDDFHKICSDSSSVSISQAAQKKTGEYWKEMQTIQIQEKFSLKQTSESSLESEVTAKKESEKNPWGYAGEPVQLVQYTSEGTTINAFSPFWGDIPIQADVASKKTHYSAEEITARFSNVETQQKHFMGWGALLEKVFVKTEQVQIDEFSHLHVLC